MRIVHTSDVHLDNSSHGDHHSADMFRRVVDSVLSERADLFLIAGDLFDHNRVKQHAVDFVYDELARVRCPVVLIPGNHDCVAQGSIYHRVDFSAAGRHVHALTDADGHRVILDELHATVWGKGMVDHEPENQPLAGVPERHEDRWHIGLAHGYYVEDGQSERSSLITRREIAESGLDYLALGHVHVYMDVSQGDTRACYPGSPSRDYAGSGSVALVTLDPEQGVRFERLYIHTDC